MSFPDIEIPGLCSHLPGKLGWWAGKDGLPVEFFPRLASRLRKLRDRFRPVASASGTSLLRARRPSRNRVAGTSSSSDLLREGRLARRREVPLADATGRNLSRSFRSRDARRGKNSTGSPSLPAHQPNFPGRWEHNPGISISGKDIRARSRRTLENYARRNGEPRKARPTPHCCE